MDSHDLTMELIRLFPPEHLERLAEAKNSLKPTPDEIRRGEGLSKPRSPARDVPNRTYKGNIYG